MPLFSKGQDKFKYSFSCSAYLLSEYVHIVCLFFLEDCYFHSFVVVFSWKSRNTFSVSLHHCFYILPQFPELFRCVFRESGAWDAAGTSGSENNYVYHTSQKPNQMINRQRNAAAASNTLPFYREIVTPVTHSILSATEMRRNYYSLTHLSFILL